LALLREEISFDDDWRNDPLLMEEVASMEGKQRSSRSLDKFRAS